MYASVFVVSVRSLNTHAVQCESFNTNCLQYVLLAAILLVHGTEVSVEFKAST